MIVFYLHNLSYTHNKTIILVLVDFNNTQYILCAPLLRPAFGDGLDNRKIVVVCVV